MIDAYGAYYVLSDKDYVFVSIKGGFTGNKVIWSKYLDYCDKPQRIALEAGQTVKVYYGTARLKNTPFTDDDYYQYEQPSGTYVPVGKYVVGEDIPEGIYYAYAGTIEGGTIKVYENKPDLNTGYNGDKYDYYDPFVNKSGQYELVELKGGQVMFVEKDVIMKKQPKLVFD